MALVLFLNLYYIYLKTELFLLKNIINSIIDKTYVIVFFSLDFLDSGLALLSTLMKSVVFARMQECM